jgi:MYXO-CTERM domain-containing protein
MKPLHTLTALGALLLSAGEAMPCGGAFGPNYTIDPAQKIVVAYRDGNETYVFNPRFCGRAESFGLILPVPAALTANPSLGTGQLYTDLSLMTAPTVVTRCGVLMKGATDGTGGKASAGGSGSAGTTVIDRGQVGIFDWALLQATSVASFTDWLDANGFPYQPSAVNAFQYYVDGGWYFVAFKVSTGTGTSGGAGGGASGAGGKGGTGGVSAQICGTFGPIVLSFPAPAAPVVPARIASVSSGSLSWTIYALATEQMQIQNLGSELRFSGAVGASELETYPAVAPLAREGDRLTELLVTSAPSQDFVLEPNPSPTDYRREQIQIVYCSGGSAAVGGAPSTGGTAPYAGGTAPRAGAPASGGTTSSVGTPSTGGTPSEGGAVASVSLTGGNAEATMPQAKGGCSVGPGRPGHPRPALAWLAALIGLAVWAKRRARPQGVSAKQ